MHPIDAADHVRPLKLVLAHLQAGRNDDPPRDYFICSILSHLRDEGMITDHECLSLTAYIQSQLYPSGTLESWGSRVDPENLRYAYANIPLAHLYHELRICWVEKMIYDLERQP